MDFETYKTRCLQQIWGKICEIVTDIHYSSKVAERERHRQYRIYSFLFCLILTIPAVIDLLVNYEVIGNQSWWVVVLDIVYIVVPIIVTIKFPDFANNYIGYNEKEISELLSLNMKLEVYLHKLMNAYAKAESSKTLNELWKIDNDFQQMNFEHEADLFEHDKLTGEIDHTIEREAQKKAMEYLKRFYEIEDKNYDK